MGGAAAGVSQHQPSLFPVICLAVIGHTAFTASRLTVSLAAIQMKAPTLTVGLLLSLYALLPMLLSVHAGRWLDRVGTRVPMLTGTAVIGVGFAVPTVWLSMPALFFNSLMVGTGFMLFHMSIQKLTGELADGPERMRNFGYLAVGFSISAFFGPIIAGQLIDHAGAGASFGASFGASGLLIVLAFALLRWRWTFSGQTLLEQGQPAQSGKVLDLLGTPQLRRLYLSVVLTSTAWDVHMFLTPIQGSKIGLSASQIGVVLGAFAAATFLVRMALPLLVRRFSEWQLIGTVQLVACGVYLAFPLVSTHYGLIVLSFVLGLGLGVGQPAVMSLLHQVSPPGRVGEAVGLRMTLINGTQTVLPTAFGGIGSLLAVFFSGALAYAPLYWAVALMSGAGALGSLRQKIGAPPAAPGPR
jgi:MFS family permease